MKRCFSPSVWATAAVLLLPSLVPAALAAQVPEPMGIAATGLLLRQMDGVKRVLMIGAHPDDEDTGFLTAMSRGLGVETAYLALTRGDGGQNLIGPELWEGLGVIRTGELVAARGIDGGEQFFTRAFDFGYSKTADESLSLWSREELLHDVVWVVRRFRPQVIIAVFSDTPAAGHGHHQASGILARDAFVAAGDPARFPDQLERGVAPWTPAKLYQTIRRQPSQATGGVDTGSIDPLLGRSLHQLSALSRSQHRSQDMGAAQPPGPRRALVRFIASNVGGGADSGIFEHVDTALASLVDGLDESRARSTAVHLEAYRAAVRQAEEQLGVDPGRVIGPLGMAVEALGSAVETAGPHASDELRNVLARKTALATRALLSAAGVVVDVRSEDDLVVPGQSVQVGLQVWNGGPTRVRGVEPAMSLPAGWGSEVVSVNGLGPDGSVAAGALAEWVYRVDIPADADFSRLYYLREARDGASYRWPDEPHLWGLPRDPVSVHGLVSFSLDAGEATTPISTETPWRFVGVDQARGEFYKPVLVVPALSARVAPSGLVWPQDRGGSSVVTVAVSSAAPTGLSGEIRLEAPDDWSVTPGSQAFELGGEGAERTVSFEVEPTGTPAAGEHLLQAVVTSSDGREFTEGVSLIDYEHIERVAMFSDAVARITVVPVRIADGVRIGYVMGTGDDGPDAIRQLGGQVDLLGPDEVRDGDFTSYDAVVLGVRAYETRADLGAANEQLLDYARAGGTVIVQYNQYQFSNGGYAPYPLAIGRPAARVADETAPVRMLDPEAPLFTTPNRITEADFEGWVQERGLYFLSEWDSAFVPLLEMNDEGEPPRRGSLLVAPVGEGLYVYAALSFFRQFPFGVPGAYRLFANLISLNAADWAAYASSRAGTANRD